MTGSIFHIQRFSLHDGPGIRTTVFFKGCPLRCQWCHNPESIAREQQLLLRSERCVACGDCAARCPHGAAQTVKGTISTERQLCLVCGTCVSTCYADAREIVGKEITVEEALTEIEKDRVFYGESGGGATFSGGEPLLQHEFLCALLTACRRRGIHTVVDTSGYAPPGLLDRVAPLADLFLFDIKTLDDRKHRKHTGVSNRTILENLRRLAAQKASIIVRVPLVPGVNDDEESIRSIGEFVRTLDGVRGVHILPYHRTGTEKYRRLGMTYQLNGTLPPSSEDIMRAVTLVRKYTDSVGVGGNS
jgi:pyruvate formate lyase activating enzyme